MRERGYAAVSARNVASQASLKNHQVIYYYFKNHDDMLRAVFHRRAEKHLEAIRAAMNAKNILRALWQYYNDPNESWFQTEFMAVANHVKSVRKEIAHYGSEFRKLEMEAIRLHFKKLGRPEEESAGVISLIMGSLSRVMARETALGVRTGHDEAEQFIEQYLRRFDS